jgi:hypothetical protein
MVIGSTTRFDRAPLAARCVELAELNANSANTDEPFSEQRAYRLACDQHIGDSVRCHWL